MWLHAHLMVDGSGNWGRAVWKQWPATLLSWGHQHGLAKVGWAIRHLKILVSSLLLSLFSDTAWSPISYTLFPFATRVFLTCERHRCIWCRPRCCFLFHNCEICSLGSKFMLCCIFIIQTVFGCCPSSFWVTPGLFTHSLFSKCT